MTPYGAEGFPLSWPKDWPRARSRQDSRYKTAFTKARDGLLRELRLLGGSGIILSSNLPLRRDGLPYAGQAQPTDPGVAVYWNRRGKPGVIACDHWRKVEDNLHAIELTIEALRMIERTGASQLLDRAFEAFAALPPAPNGTLKWRDVFGFKPGPVTRHQPDQLYRKLARMMRCWN